MTHGFDSSKNVSGISKLSTGEVYTVVMIKPKKEGELRDNKWKEDEGKQIIICSFFVQKSVVLEGWVGGDGWMGEPV